jgi:hypothetical protein
MEPSLKERALVRAQSQPAPSNHPSNVAQFMDALATVPLATSKSQLSPYWDNVIKNKPPVFDRAPKTVLHHRERVKRDLMAFQDRLEKEPDLVKQDLELHSRWKL